MKVQPYSYSGLGRVCAANEDPIFDGCVYVPPSTNVYPAGLCPPGDPSCVMTGPSALERLRRDPSSDLYQHPIFSSPIVWIGLAAALVILMKR